MRFEGLSAPQCDILAERFSPFVLPEGEPGPAEADLRVGLRRAGVERFLAPRGDAAEIYRMGRRFTGGRMTLWSYEFAGWVEAQSRRAELALVEPAGSLFERGLENFLRVVTANFILDRGGLLVHGAGVVRNGEAHIFFGPSGSGKTTVTHFSPRDMVLSDDLTLVVPHPDGGYAAAGIPFGMAHHRRPATQASFRIGSFNRLVQSREVRREAIAGGRAVAEISGSLPFVMQDAAQAGRALDTVERVLRDIPAYRLFFRRDDSFWNVVATR